MKSFKGIGDAPKKTQADLIKEYVAPKVDLDGKDVMRPEWKIASLLKRSKALTIDFKKLENLRVIISSNGSFSVVQPNEGEGLNFLGKIHSVVKTINKDKSDEKKILKLLLTWTNGVKDPNVKPEFYELKDIQEEYEKNGETKTAIAGFEIMKYDAESKKTSKVGSITLPPKKTDTVEESAEVDDTEEFNEDEGFIDLSDD